MGEVMSDVKDILSEVLRALEENKMEQQERKSLYPISSHLSHRYVKGIILRTKKKQCYQAIPLPVILLKM